MHKLQLNKDGFMSDWIVKKSLIEREQDALKESQDKAAEKEIKTLRETKGIVLAIHTN